MEENTAKKVEAEVMEDEVSNEAPAPLQSENPSNLSDTLQTPEEKLDRDVLETENGILNLLSEAPGTTAAILRLQKENPEYLEMDEQTARNEFRRSITLNVLRLRMSLWSEYEYARTRNRKMRVSQIWAGVCTQSTWNKTIQDNQKLAFILTPPSDYLVVLKEAHSAGLDTLRDIVSAKVIDENGVLNSKAADAVIKAFALLDMRLKGAVVQRVDQRVISKNENINIGIPGGQAAIGSQLPQNMDELDKMIANVREEIKKISTPKHPTIEQLSHTKQSLQIDTISNNELTDVVSTGKVYESKTR